MRLQGGPRFAVNFIILIIFVSGFFCALTPLSPPLVRGENTPKHPLVRGEVSVVRAEAEPVIVINEIAWMGNGESANSEWIELRNRIGAAIDLAGWKLAADDGIPNIELSGSIAADGYYLLERTNDETVTGVTADMIYVGALGNNGESLTLRDNAGNAVDRVEAASGWAAGSNFTKATMERNDDETWHDSVLPGGTPKAENSQVETNNPDAICGNGSIETGEICDDGNITAGDGCSSTCLVEETEEASDTPPPESTDAADEPVVTKKYKLGAVVINEFVSDPADNDTEWVEIYNTLASEISLVGWYLEEGSGSRTNLSGKLSTAGNSRFLVIDKPKGNLNNSGDALLLYDQTGTLIDRVNYGNWQDEADSNAPTASDPTSVARLFDGYNTYNNHNDFAVTNQPTKGNSNVVTGGDSDIDGNANYDYSEDVKITEVFPNPDGADTDKEWIELYNAGERDVKLYGWKLTDASKSKHSFGAADIIPAKSYLVLYRKDTKLALNNDKDSIMLYQPEKDKPFLNLRYQDVKEGWSYSYDSAEGKWVWSETVTPGADNVITAANRPPLVEFACPEQIQIGTPYLFDSSDVVDPDGDELAYEWDFGDGITSRFDSPQHTYLTTGNLTIRLKASDGRAEVKKECIIKAVAELAGEVEAGDGDSPDAGLVMISELLPNPIGADADEEWIELYNYGNVRINLRDWRLQDSSAGKPYAFADSFWFEAGKYLVLEREETKIALNNDSDAVKLYDGADKLIDQADYSGAKEGLAYARGADRKWSWTIEPTPGSANKITINALASKTAKKPASKSAAAKSLISADLARISDFETGDNIRVQGKVAVLPGVLGSQFFYIVGGRGLQVYNYKKAFPALKIGDLVRVTGELSEINGEKRLKTKTGADIEVMAGGEPPQPLALTGDKLDENSVGSLIALNGEVVETKGSSWVLDDGTEEAEVYLKKNTGISSKAAKAGETAVVTGIASRTKDSIRIMPRSPEDIIVAKAQDPGRVLGAVSESAEWSLEQRDKKLELFKYLLVLAVAAIVVLAGFMLKYKKAFTGSEKQK